VGRLDTTSAGGWYALVSAATHLIRAHRSSALAAPPTMPDERTSAAPTSVSESKWSTVTKFQFCSIIIDVDGE
jgi:hypothetical protein